MRLTHIGHATAQFFIPTVHWIISQTRSIVSAVEDALRPFGVKFTEHPLSPEAILGAIRNSGLPGEPRV